MADASVQRGSLVEAVQRHAAASAFGRPLVQNNLRALVVEAMVDLALPSGWTWTSGDWAAWDFQHAEGACLEVKQSAAQQTWTAPARPSPPRFDIAERQGRWEDGSRWVAEPGRYAHLYVFAHHPVLGEAADHRDPEQWRFHVVPTAELPVARTISLVRLQAMSEAVVFGELGEAVERLRAQLGSRLSPG